METLGRHKSKQAPILNLVEVTASSILEVVILASVGYLLARRGVIDKKTQTKINKLNVSFFTPALLFSKVAFSLNPARLAELLIVPFGFVVVTLVSTFSAVSLAWLFGVKGAKRNFAIACAISPNSNSLPVALMQSLVTTVPQLHWEEEGEPEDTIDGMLGRALTYLVLYSTLGMFLRWSVGARLLSSVDEEENKEDEGGAEQMDQEIGQEHRETEEETSRERGRSRNRSHAKDGEIEEMEEGMGLIGETPLRRGSSSSVGSGNKLKLGSGNSTPSLSIRRATEDGGSVGRLVDLDEEDEINGKQKKKNSRSRSGPPGWTRSFPNATDGDNQDDYDEDDLHAASSGGRNQVDEEWGESEEFQNQRVSNLRSSSFLSRMAQKVSRFFNIVVVRPVNGVLNFMTAPLWAATLSLIVALIPPLQKGLDSVEPLVGALQTAGACSIPLTMVVLGAYFHEEKPEKKEEVGKGGAPTLTGNGLTKITEEPRSLLGNGNGDGETGADDPWRRSSIDSSPSNDLSSSSSTLNSGANPATNKRKSWMRNPWASNSNSNINSGGSESGDASFSVSGSAPGSVVGEGEDQSDPLLSSRHSQAQSNALSNSLSNRKTPEQIQSSLQNRTILISILARMFLTPLILIPPLAWYAISTKSNVVDDPVFVCCAVLLIGSPPALTLAQITSQASKGGGGFERLISRTIFVAYAILAAPTTVILVLTALLIAENDHKRGGGPNTIGVLNRSWM